MDLLVAINIIIDGMDYQPKYTSLTDIETFLQYEITPSTRPNQAQVLEWIQEIETEIDSQMLGWETGAVAGSGYSTTLYLDVTKRDKDRKKLFLDYPIIKMIYLKRRTSKITESPTWEDLKEGFYVAWVESANTDYKVIWTVGKCGQRYGVGIEFLSDKLPEAEPAALKASFRYSYNIPKAILKRYATLRVAILVAEAVVTSGEPTRIAGFVGGDFQTFVNTQLATQIADWRKEIDRIEKHLFPTRPLKVSL